MQHPVTWGVGKCGFCIATTRIEMFGNIVVVWVTQLIIDLHDQDKKVNSMILYGDIQPGIVS